MKNVTGDCFHCGVPLPEKTYAVIVEGVAQPTCCRGCQAVAETIVGSGLGAYYRTRSTLPATPEESRNAHDQLGLYDLPEVQRGFVHEIAAGSGEKEAAILLQGITCAACVWLIERRVAALPGVQSVTVNYAARRARIRWDNRETQLSTIMAAIEGLGYSAQPYDPARADDALRAERRTLLWRLFVAGFAMMQVMMYAVPVYLAEGTMTADIVQLMRIAGLLLTVPVVVWAAAPFYCGAWRELRQARVGMDIPIAAGVLIAFTASAAATVMASGDVYFDSVTMFVFLLLSARFLELGARTRASWEQERLMKLVPATAERLDRFPYPSRQERVASVSLRSGDIVLVRPGAVIPVDGMVLDGVGAADESLLTGEARPAAKAHGDRVIGGSVNRQGALVVRVERVGEDSVLSGIVRLMDRAQTQKPHIAVAADRAARVFVAMVLALAIGAALAWYVIDPTRVLWIAVAVLVVSCPCALSLATPAALTAASGALYKSGVLVTRAHALETLARATHFVFDKTGTLTSGTVRLVGVLPLDGRPREAALRLAAALESRSEHPIGTCIVSAAHVSDPGMASRIENVAGRGIEGIVDGVRLRIGTPEFVQELNGLPPPGLLKVVSDGVSVVALGDDRGWVALLTFAETLRPEAKRLVHELRSSGKAVCVLSGDREARVRHVANELGIAIVRAQASPDDKVEFVKSLQANGAVVAMIGDGVNDAPVLAQAQVSIALASGAQLAQNRADIVLMGDQLAAFRTAVTHSRRAMRIIRQNLIWATLYNAIALPLAAVGLVTPLLAAVGMSASSLVVVMNALRLVGRNSDRTRRREATATSVISAEMRSAGA